MFLFYIYTWWALSYTRRTCFCCLSPTQFSFSHPAPRCINSKFIFCAHLLSSACWSENEVCSGALLTCCNFEELNIDCAIDQLKPGIKSKVNGAIFVLLFKEPVSRKCASGRIHNARSLCLFHTGTRSSTQTCKIILFKCKIILLCRLHKYKNVIYVIIDSCCMYQN